jgi:hypothetical protein
MCSSLFLTPAHYDHLQGGLISGQAKVIGTAALGSERLGEIKYSMTFLHGGLTRKV